MFFCSAPFDTWIILLSGNLAMPLNVCHNWTISWCAIQVIQLSGHKMTSWSNLWHHEGVTSIYGVINNPRRNYVYLSHGHSQPLMFPMIEQRLQAIKRRSLGKSFHLRQRFGQSSYPIINREPVLPFQYLNNNGQGKIDWLTHFSKETRTICLKLTFDHGIGISAKDRHF